MHNARCDPDGLGAKVGGVAVTASDEQMGQWVNMTAIVPFRLSEKRFATLRVSMQDPVGLIGASPLPQLGWEEQFLTWAGTGGLNVWLYPRIPVIEYNTETPLVGDDWIKIVASGVSASDPEWIAGQKEICVALGSLVWLHARSESQTYDWKVTRDGEVVFEETKGRCIVSFGPASVGEYIVEVRNKNGDLDTGKVIVVEALVEFLDAKGKPTAVLKVSKWEKAFQEGDPPVNPNFIDLDPDGFYVRVQDAAKKGNASITIRLATDGPDDEYDDNPTVIELPLKAGSTFKFESAALMLMSDHIDDKYPVDGIADDDNNDRTHVVALPGKVKVEYDLRPGVAVNAEADVPAPTYLKTVTLHAVILKDGDKVLIGEPFIDSTTADGVWTSDPEFPEFRNEKYRDVDGDNNYTANLSEANARKRVEEDIKVVKERLAQIGLKVEYTIEFKQAPDAIKEKNGLVVLKPVAQLPITGDDNLSDDEKALLQAAGAGQLRTNAADDIEVYYASQIQTEVETEEGKKFLFPWGVAFEDDDYTGMTTPDANDTIVIPNHTNLYGLAHEICHILSQSKQQSQNEWSLFYHTGKPIVDDAEARVTGTRRLFESDTPEVLFRNNEYVK